MKVTTDTPDMLIVDDRPILIGIALTLFIMVFVGAGIALVLSGEWMGLIFGGIGGGLGLGAFFAFVRRVQVVFHRPEGWVEFRRKNLLGGSRVRHALAEVDRAEIEQSRMSNGSATYRVVLVLETGQSAGRHPVTLAFSNGASHHIIAAKINAWLQAGGVAA